MVQPIITLTTDFGLKDSYVAEMKAVIFGLNRNVAIVDVSHEIDKFNIRMGAYILASAAPYFPDGTIHVAVIDPTVGSGRRAILIETERAFFVGPDNGVFALACRKNAIRHVYEITNMRVMLQVVSSTFQGRDLFAPAAAHLADGLPAKEFGPEIRRIVRPEFARIIRKRNAIIGKVIHVDDFGNIVTSFQETDFSRIKRENYVNVKLGDSMLKLKFCKTYAEVKKRAPLIIIGSHGFLELAMNAGNAAKAFGLKGGDKVVFYLS